MNPGQYLQLKHYLIENRFSKPYLHRYMNRQQEESLIIIILYFRSQIRLTGSDVDSERDFIWCQFKRPLRSKSMWDLDLSQPLFHFFFKGEKNDSM